MNHWTHIQFRLHLSVKADLTHVACIQCLQPGSMLWSSTVDGIMHNKMHMVVSRWLLQRWGKCALQIILCYKVRGKASRKMCDRGKGPDAQTTHASCYFRVTHFPTHTHTHIHTHTHTHAHSIVYIHTNTHGLQTQGSNKPELWIQTSSNLASHLTKHVTLGKWVYFSVTQFFSSVNCGWKCNYFCYRFLNVMYSYNLE